MPTNLKASFGTRSVFLLNCTELGCGYQCRWHQDEQLWQLCHVMNNEHIHISVTVTVTVSAKWRRLGLDFYHHHHHHHHQQKGASLASLCGWPVGVSIGFHRPAMGGLEQADARAQRQHGASWGGGRCVRSLLFIYYAVTASNMTVKMVLPHVLSSWLDAAPSEAAPHRGGQTLLRASLHRWSRAAGCWCQGVQTPQGGAQQPQRHHESQKGNGCNIIIFMFSLGENILQPHVSAHRRDPTICHEKALTF